MGMPVFGRSRVPLLPTNRRPTRRCLSGILFEQIVSNPWISPSNAPCRKSRPRSIRPSCAHSQNNRHDRQVASTSPVENRDAEERPDTKRSSNWALAWTRSETENVCLIVHPTSLYGWCSIPLVSVYVLCQRERNCKIHRWDQRKPAASRRRRL